MAISTGVKKKKSFMFERILEELEGLVDVDDSGVSEIPSGHDTDN